MSSAVLRGKETLKKLQIFRTGGNELDGCQKHRRTSGRPCKNTIKEIWHSLFYKNESLNNEIDGALKKADSKSGGRGGNFPDIKVFLEMPNRCYIPVVIEVKGMSRCLEKKNPEHEITNLTKKGEPDYAAIQKYAVNGAVHYAEAIIKESLINSG